MGPQAPEIRRGLRFSQTHKLSIPRLAKHTLRNAKRALTVVNEEEKTG